MSRIFDELFIRYPVLDVCKNDIKNAYNAMVECYDNGGKLLCCGNGGSAADCDHLVGELMKGFLKKRPLSDNEKQSFENPFIADSLQKGLPAISLCAHSALMTAFSNDEIPSLVLRSRFMLMQKSTTFLLLSALRAIPKTLFMPPKPQRLQA